VDRHPLADARAARLQRHDDAIGLRRSHLCAATARKASKHTFLLTTVSGARFSTDVPQGSGRLGGKVASTSEMTQFWPSRVRSAGWMIEKTGRGGRHQTRRAGFSRTAPSGRPRRDLRRWPPRPQENASQMNRLRSASAGIAMESGCLGCFDVLVGADLNGRSQLTVQAQRSLDRAKETDDVDLLVRRFLAPVLGQMTRERGSRLLG
jgi:hypothetical protein